MAACVAGWATASSRPGRSCWVERGGRGREGDEEEEERAEDEVMLEDRERCWCGSRIAGVEPEAETEAETAGKAEAGGDAICTACSAAGARVCSATPCCGGKEPEPEPEPEPGDEALLEMEIVESLLDSPARPMAGRMRKGETSHGWSWRLNGIDSGGGDDENLWWVEAGGRGL